MATVTAAISLSSDIADATMTLSKSSTLTKAGSSKGLDTSTYTRKTFTATTHVDLVSASGYSAGANKVYICNESTDETFYVVITIDSTVIGRLYAGDWMFIPWGSLDQHDDIEIQAYTGTNRIGYAFFHEGRTLTSA